MAPKILRNWQAFMEMLVHHPNQWAVCRNVNSGGAYQGLKKAADKLGVDIVMTSRDVPVPEGVDARRLTDTYVMVVDA